MDEVLIANFMIFQDAVDEGGYDLVIADEAWDIDHYWHEHPELKKAKLAWFTDFVGYVPMPSGGEHEAFLTTDYNAEMIEHIERHPGVRDRAIFVGDPEDIVPLSFGKDLPAMRDWVPRHFDFAGYIIGEHPRTFGSRAELRRSARLPARRARMHRHGRRLGRRRASDQAHSAELPDGPGQAARAAHDRGGGPAHRSGVARSRRPASRCAPSCRTSTVISRPAIWPLVQGGLTTCMELDRCRNAVPLLPAQEPFRAELPRRAPSRPLRRRTAHGVRDVDAGHDCGCDGRLRCGRRPRFKPVEADGAARAARMLADLV